MFVAPKDNPEASPEASSFLYDLGRVHRVRANSTVHVLDGVMVPCDDFELSEKMLSSLRSCFEGLGQKYNKSTTAASCILVSSLLSRMLRALSVLLRNAGTVETFLSAGLGPYLLSIAEANEGQSLGEEAASAADNADIGTHLATVESHACRLLELSSERHIMNAAHSLCT